jgi:transmembrane sensor
MTEDYIWNLIAKKLSGEATESELLVLEKLLRENPDLHYPVQTIMDLWTSNAPLSQESHDAFQRHVERMKDLKIDFTLQAEEDSLVPTTRFNSKIGLWPALAVVLVIGALFFGIRLTESQPSELPAPVKETAKAFSQISTRNGSRTTLILPDGTKVWMNAGSTLMYDSSFGKTIREVNLSGEAFFDVTKNKEKPFVIHTSNINIKVIGTAFNVRSYPTDKTLEASLIRGSIEVTFKDRPDKKIILKPNEKIVVDNRELAESVPKNSRQSKPDKSNPVYGVDVKKLTHELKTGTIIETSWVEDKLIFQDESFDEIARLLERWYGVSIIFKNNRLKDDHLTGSFRNETIRQALDALKFTATFNYEIDKNNNITIY